MTMLIDNFYDESQWFDHKSEYLNELVIPNFKLYEFICRCGVCNVTWLNKLALMALGSVREEWGQPIKLSSGYRCCYHNKHIYGSAHWSYHMKGMAFDLKIPFDKDERFRFMKICETYFSFTILNIQGGYIHCDVRGL